MSGVTVCLYSVMALVLKSLSFLKLYQSDRVDSHSL